MCNCDGSTPTVATGIQPHRSSDLCRMDSLFHATMEDDTQGAHGRHEEVSDKKTTKATANRFASARQHREPPAAPCSATGRNTLEARGAQRPPRHF